MTLDMRKTDTARARMFDELGRQARREARRVPEAEACKAELRITGARLFAQFGLDGASLADIGMRLGKGSTYCQHYYRNRDALLYDILHDHVAKLEQALEEADPVPPPGEPDPQADIPPVERLDALARALLDELAEREPAQRVLLAALNILPETDEETLRYLLRALIWRVERVLLLAIPRLSRRRALLFPLAASFVAMAAHYVLWFQDKGRLAREEYARLIVRVTIAGGNAAYRQNIGKRRGLPKPRRPSGPLLGEWKRPRASRSPV